MKNFILCLFSIFTITVSYAQPDFTSADMPDIGDQDTLMYLVYQPITNNLEKETGNGYTWDFSALPFSTYPKFIKLDYFRVKTSFVSNDFPNATIEEFVNDGTAGDVNLYSFRNDTMFLHRSGAVVAGLACVPAIPVTVFPIKFNAKSVATGYFYASIYTTGSRVTTLSYDGYGTLKLPNNKTYTDVFRIKKTEKDTNYVTHTSITYTNYIWYKKGGQVPLLRLNYTGATNLYFVHASKANGILTGVDELNSTNSFTIYPNPSSGKFQLSGIDQLSASKIEVYNSYGAKVLQSDVVSELDLSGFPQGIYSVTVYQDKNTTTKKMVIK